MITSFTFGGFPSDSIASSLKTIIFVVYILCLCFLLFIWLKNNKFQFNNKMIIIPVRAMKMKRRENTFN